MPSEMGQAAIDRLSSAPAAPQETPPPADPNVGAPPPQEAQPQTPEAQPAQDEGFEEFEYGGERHKLSRADRHYLMQIGLETYEQLRAARENPQQQPQAQPAQQGEPIDPVQAEIQRLSGIVDSMVSEKRKETIKTSAERALESNAYLSDWAKRQPTERNAIMAEIIFQQANSGMNFATAAKAVENRWSGRFKADRAIYAQQKIESAGRRPEMGGSFPAKQQQMGRREFRNGAIKNAAIERAERHAAASR